ncbi:MAG: glycosyltransferase [Geminicoccaceae bacterium]
MILVAVGTYIHGFDELVTAADGAAATSGLPGFAQIGHSRAVPRHLAWERFLPPAELAHRLAAARLVICHGGIGLLGEAMRAGKPIIAVPRQGRPTRDNPAGDQTALVRRLAERYPIMVCGQVRDLPSLVQRALKSGLPAHTYDLQSNVPQLLTGFLATGNQPTPATRSNQPSATLRPKRSARS